MSSVGRGRGYTGRHHIREEIPRPGDEAANSEMEPECNSKFLDTKAMGKISASEDQLSSEFETDSSIKELIYIDEQYRPLLSLLEQFCPGEDGIQFNRKLRHFETTITNTCTDEVTLFQVFSTFRAAALINAVTARKLATVGASFTRQQRQHVLRNALLNIVMQGTYSKLDVLEKSNPLYLINATNLMGDYFAEARLSNGNKVQILAAPLLEYMKSLLATSDIRAHRSLATQLMQNGRELLTLLSQELDDLSISIRIRLLNPPPVSLIWLLLSADLCLNRFLPLPNTLQQFYASHLDLTQEDQGPNYNEVNYGSWKKSPEKESSRNVSLAESSLDANASAELNSQSLSQISLNQEESADSHLKPKLRPILGAGAGLLRQEALTQNTVSASQDSFDTWTNKSSLAKRYDLNSWRQNGEDTKEEDPVFDPSVLPPMLGKSYPSVIKVPDYPPPTLNPNLIPSNNLPTPPIVTPPSSVPQNSASKIPVENIAPQNFLQQGDGIYIQSHTDEAYNNANVTYPHGDGIYVSSQQYPNQALDNALLQNMVQGESHKTSNTDRPKKPIENWRKEKSDLSEDQNKNRQNPKVWGRQRSKDSLEKEADDNNGETRGSKSSLKCSRDGRPSVRQSKKKEEAFEVPKNRRHVMDVPRGQKYWDHDDRCDKDYPNS